MSRLRAFLIALTILAMAVAPMLIPNIGLSTPSGTPAYAAVAGAPVNQDNDNDDDDDDDNDDDDDDDDDNDNNNDDDDSDDNDNGNDDDDNDDSDDNDNGGDDGDNDDDHDDNGGVAAPPPPSQSAAPPPPSQSSASPTTSACSTPGQEMSFESSDGRIVVRVFPAATQSLRFSIRQPIDPASVPAAPGPVVGGLLFQLIAETCDGTPVPVLQSEVNLGVRYGDGDVAGLNEANFTLSRLDTSANQWRAVVKQANDPPANFASATITEMGFYVLHQRS